MKHIFIINPHAGKTDSRQRIDDMADILRKAGEEQALSIRIQREDIFQAMHRI